jgi:hypothetical protein
MATTSKDGSRRANYPLSEQFEEVVTRNNETVLNRGRSSEWVQFKPFNEYL